MKKNKHQISSSKNILLLFVFLLSACEKKEDDFNYSENKVELVLLSPQSNQIVTFSNNITVNGRVSYVRPLHGYSVEIKKDIPSGEVLFQRFRHTHSTAIDIWEQWENSLTSTNDLVVLLTIHKDHTNSNNEIFEYKIQAVYE